MARYKIESRWLEEVRVLIAEFVDAIKEYEPGTSYIAYQENSGDWFTHLMSFTDGKAEDEHRNARYTARFVEQLYPKCEIQPEFYDLDAVAETG